MLCITQFITSIIYIIKDVKKDKIPTLFKKYVKLYNSSLKLIKLNR